MLGFDTVTVSALAAVEPSRDHANMSVRTILLLGDPRLYEASMPVARNEVEDFSAVIEDLHDTMRDFQRRHGWGRAIAAPQIGVHKRIVCMQVDEPLTLINPTLDQHSSERQEFWEDCMSFPELLVHLSNPRECRLTYEGPDFVRHRVQLEGDYAELLQHEVDHLDGILAVQRALDDRSITLRRAMPAKALELRGMFRPL